MLVFCGIVHIHQDTEAELRGSGWPLADRPLFFLRAHCLAGVFLPWGLLVTMGDMGWGGAHATGFV